MNCSVWVARMPIKATGSAAGVCRARPENAPASWLGRYGLVAGSTLEWSVVQMRICLCFLWVDMCEVLDCDSCEFAIS